MPTRARLVRPLMVLLLIGLIAASAVAAPVNRPLDADQPDAPAVTQRILRHDLQGLSLRLDLGQVGVDEVTLAGRTWSALTLADGVLDGRPGETALPVWSTLVAVPEGAQLAVSAAAARQVIWHDLDLAPQTHNDGTLAATDLVGKAASRRPDLVDVGRPARLAGLTVVPVTIRPVSYDADTRQAVIASRVDVELNWSGADFTDQRRVSGLVSGLAAGAVANWPEVRDLVTDPDGTYGTWAIVLPSSSGFPSLVEPLVQWRRQQGYNVVVTHLGETGATKEAILAYLQNLYDTVDPPLEFVTLVGDGAGSIVIPTWRESLSGYRGEGDHPYTLLDGDDQLPDVHIGRLSVTNTTQLSTMVTKIVQYETNPPMDDPDWFSHGLAVGDPSDSGISTVYCARWLAGQLYGIGFDRVDQILSGDYATSMYNSLNQGRSVFGYRGFYGVSGFTEGHIMALENGGKLPFALFPTCESSSWLGTTTARSEAFLRNARGGAIGAIGTATPGTHTRYNNCLFYGTMDGLINSDEHRQGSALSHGKLELFRNYGVPEPDVVEIWSTWNTLMGDPATDIWLAQPTQLTVTHAPAIPGGASALAVSVVGDAGPVAGAHVAAVSGDSWRVVARTDDDGQVLLPLDGDLPGDLTLTVTGHNLLPYQGQVSVMAQDHWVTVTGLTLDGDGLAGPAETVAVVFAMQNPGQETVTGLELAVTSDSTWLTVLDGPQSLTDLAPGGTTDSATYRLAVAPRAPHGARPQLRLTVTGDQGTWVNQAELVLQGPDLREDGVNLDPGVTAPGSNHDLVINLTNQGALPAAGGSAVLRSRSLWVTIDDSTATVPAAPVGATVSNQADPFHVTFDAGMVAGASVPLTMVVEHVDGVEQRLDLIVAVGELTVTDPTGGDEYGYYAFDSGDVGYAETRPFDWVEIDPTRGGQGEDAGLSDTFYEHDDVVVKTLPFTFQYYGQPYNELSICSNGWVSFGATNEVFWRNWTIPAPGSPSGMVAVFWDDLREMLDNQVYHWYDASEHRYIVQWSRMNNLSYGQQTCQVILLDPEHYPTRSGDGIIVCQYLEVDNNDTERGYATLGIQSPDRRQGVCYSYYAIEAPGAATPAAGLAITYQTAGRREARTCDVSPASLSLTLPEGGQDDLTLHVLNDGEPGDPLVFTVDHQDPALITAAGRNMEGSTAAVAETAYWPGEAFTLNLTVTNNSQDDEWIEGFTVDMPAGVTLLGGTDLVGSDGHTLTWQGNAGDGVPAHWLGSGAQMLHPGAVATASFSLEVDFGVGDLALPWTIFGDGYGGEPHTVGGVFNLSCSGNLLALVTPDGGEIWSQGQTRAIVWDASDDVDTIDLHLSRDDGATWEDLALSVPASDLSYTWTVAGAVTPDARVRIRSTAVSELMDVSSAPFIIQHDLSWAQVTPASGLVEAGNTLEITVSVDAAGLAPGDYQQNLVLQNNAGDDVVVPLSLTVEEGSLGSDLPRATALMQNHPNPFNPSTTIRFDLATARPVDLAVFDLVGRRVAQLVTGPQRAGRHAVIWNGQDTRGRQLPSGTYLYRLVVSGEVMTRKLTLVK